MVELAISFMVSAATCAIALTVGRHHGFVDLPDGDLKNHLRGAVPLGGLGVLAGVLVGVYVEHLWEPWIMAGLAAILLGLIDDFRPLPPLLRLSLTMAIGAWTGVEVGPTGTLGIDLAAGLLLVPLCINAVNLFDGLDALASTSVTVSLLGLGVLSESLLAGGGMFLLIGSAAVVGFLPFNLPPARMFLGDGGSYLLGWMLALTVLRLLSVNLTTGLVAISLLGIIGVDFAVTIFRRLYGDRGGLFQGDREHLYDRLRIQGFAVAEIAILAAAIQTALIAATLAVTLWRGSFAGLAVAVAGEALLVTVAWRSRLIII